jgi:hypothetical protein
MMNQEQEIFFERLSKAITTCQEIHNDSRTPLSDALVLTEHIRTLHRCRQALRKEAFQTSGSQFEVAVSRLKEINDILKAEIIAHNKTMGFVTDAAMASAAVLDLAIGVGALVA